MRPNANSGCCTLENATKAAPTRNLHTSYALAAAPQLHSQSNQLTQQQQNYTPHHFHPQKQHQHAHNHHHRHHLQQQQQQFFQPATAFPWLTQQQNVYNAAQYPTNKNVQIGRQQSAQFGPHKQQQLQMSPPALMPTHSQPQQLKYNQHNGKLQHLKQQQPPQLAPPNSFVHNFNGFPNMHMRPLPPPESQSSSATSTIANLLHPSNYPKQHSSTTSTLVNQQRINECAGIPLISNATAHLAAAQRQRIQRKLSHSPVALQKLPAAAGLYMTRNTNTTSCTHISQLAAHAQGVPLLLHSQQDAQTATASSKWSMPNNGHDPQQSRNSTSSVATFTTTPTGKVVRSKTESPARTPLRHQRSAPAALSIRSSRDNTAHLATQEHSPSVEMSKENVDECGETVLPRIIKPRKRRKKDRKSTSNGVLLKLDALATSSVVESDKSRQLAQQSQLLPKPEQKRQLVLQQHNTQYLYQQENSNNNFNKFIDIYSGTQHLTENASSSRPFSTNPFQLDGSFLQPNCLNATSICLKQASTKQCVDSQDNLAVCFCRNCDPLRSIWDYPLRRSLSDSSAASIGTHSSSASSTSSASTHTSSSETASSSSSSLSALLIDDTQMPTATTPSRVERVGVIGSQRHTQDNNRDGMKLATNGCLSDSNDSHDSGYGDILSGINLADDFFCQNSYNNLSATLTPLLEVGTGLSSPPLVCQTVKTAQLYDSTSAEKCLPPMLHVTADALLSESIKEISRTLIETCGSEMHNELAAGAATTRSLRAYSRCSSDFSNDSGIESAAIKNCDELIFKFENLNFIFGDVASKNALVMNNNGNMAIAACVEHELGTLPVTEAKSGTTAASSSEISPRQLQADVNNNIESEKDMQQQPQLNEQQQQHKQQFINNCFDLVWPTTFEHCLSKTVTKTLDLKKAEPVMLEGLTTYSEVA